LARGGAALGGIDLAGLSRPSPRRPALGGGGRTRRRVNSRSLLPLDLLDEQGEAYIAAKKG
jgi:hypothetical protein